MTKKVLKSDRQKYINIVLQCYCLGSDVNLIFSASYLCTDTCQHPFVACGIEETSGNFLSIYKIALNGKLLTNISLENLMMFIRNLLQYIGCNLVIVWKLCYHPLLS